MQTTMLVRDKTYCLISEQPELWEQCQPVAAGIITGEQAVWIIVIVAIASGIAVWPTYLARKRALESEITKLTEVIKK